MAAKKFRFVSPGVKINEIDRSRLPTLPGQIGPVVIGRSLKGPSMVPVTVNSYEEFVQKFGEPSPGLGSNDIWRNGNDTAPTYGAYAAQAWLASSSPLTFVKLAGVKAEGASAGGLPGWKTDNTLTTLTSSNGGAMGLFLAKSGSAETGSLAAIFYVQTGSIILSGTAADGSTLVEGACVLIKSRDPVAPEFRMKIKNHDSSKVEDVVFDFDKNSNKFIRKVFNTNPTLTNAAITNPDLLKCYWLGETFEDHLSAADLLDSNTVAFVAGLKNATGDLGVFQHQATPAQTGWVFSQHLSDNTGSFDPATDTVPLFRFVAGEGLGSDWEQNNYKISIFDIKPPRNSYQKYGTFSVGIRNMEDTDKSPEFVEVFSNLTLDPASPDYIAARIGDRRVVWNIDLDGEGRYVEVGDYDNNSKLIRVEMNPAAAGIDGGLLPAGFFGPTRYKTMDITSAGAVGAGAVITQSVPGVVNPSKVVETYGGSLQVVFPRMPIVVSASSAGLLDETRAYFGIESADPMKQSVKDLLKIKPVGFDSHTVGTNQSLEYSFVFTLDDIVYDSANSSSYWLEGSRKAGTSYTAQSSFTELIQTREYNKFTMPLFAGFDGLDVTEKDSFNNTLLAQSADEKLNFALHSAKRAVRSLKDPEVLDMNILTVPGIHNGSVVKEAIRVCENRGDCLAIIDVNSGYRTAAEIADNSLEIGDVARVVSGVRNEFNSSYACAYYPWVQIRDPNFGVKTWIPPSIVAFGTMASSQENSEVWFAPAGFNRGGLSVGSSGLNVLSVREKLTSKQRDALYEVGVNPIASFPSEGIVIFGQKTLQAFPSALDRINVRRLVIFLKKEISRIAANVLFEPNVQDTWRRFTSPATTLLESVKGGLGIADYRLVLDETTTTPEEIDRNMMYAKLFIKPVYAIEFIGIDFIITNTGASFDDV